MPWSEVLKVVPKLDSSALAQMESSLSNRFGRIAKGFGKGLLTALKSGAITAAVLTIVDKLLNPLKETQEAIDKILHRGDQIVTNAKQFGTTAGKLFKLQQFGKSVGLEPETMNLLVEKFQSAVAQAALDPTKPSAVKQFVGEKDTAEAFFEFIQELQKMNATQKSLIQQEVFGERQILKASSFLGLSTEDFAKKNKELFKGRSAEDFTPGLEKFASVKGLTDSLSVIRDNEDVLKKGKIINNGVAQAADESARIAQDKENDRIQSYKDLATMQQASDKVVNLMEDLLLKATEIIVSLKGFKTDFEKFMQSRIIRGIFGGGGKDK